MARVYLSFLGLGSKRPDGTVGYEAGSYSLNGRNSIVTEFVQVAEIDVLGKDYFDQIIIAATEKSYNANFGALDARLRSLGAKNIRPLIIDEDLSPEGQWGWFEDVTGLIGWNDELTVDLTHGYRIIPIIFSAAINFLQKARAVRLEAVYYGAYEKDRSNPPIVDMKDFYLINEWADAVGRLIDDADARKLADVAGRSPDFQLRGLNDPALVEAFNKLTDAVRNVDVQHIHGIAADALDLVNRKRSQVAGAGEMLLTLVIDKFISLVNGEPLSGYYDRSYFALQMELATLLLEHRLFMQAFTVMRECIGSLAMVGLDREVRYDNNYGRKERYSYGDVFLRMLQMPEEKWEFDERRSKISRALMPFYGRLKGCGIVSILKSGSDNPNEVSDDLSINGLAELRNGFDHAWISKSKPPDTIEKCGFVFLSKLRNIMNVLEENGFL